MRLDIADTPIVAVPPCERPHALRPPRSTDKIRLLQGTTMGTSWNVRFFGSAQEPYADLRRDIELQLAEIDRQMSHWRSDSDLTHFNQSPPDQWHALPPELLHVLRFALSVARETGGAFDPTVGSLVDRWGFGPPGGITVLPSPEAVAAQFERCGWTKVRLDDEGRTASHSGAVSLDLSAVAKGFAVDQVANVLDRFAVRSYLAEIGGEFRATGIKKSAQPWWVAIEPPAAQAAFPEIRIALSGWSLATSGDYRRYLEVEGKRWSHTIDPRTGHPLPDAVASVSVIHRECMAADALSTALMVLGPEEGLAWGDRHAIPAVFAVRSQEGFDLLCTDAFYGMTQ